ncbi:hypothetical protein BJ165DRAFT_1407394 [Panaeolus papilionaceus]|nr:hypothetical protein BJ165DRAFT_1407394 [Panaeolus papilionaceus]
MIPNHRRTSNRHVGSAACHPPALSAPSQSHPRPFLKQVLRPRSAFLLGQGPLPSASAAERGAAHLRNRLDGLDDQDSEDGNDRVANHQILVRIPLDGAVSDMVVPATITYREFIAQVCTTMGVLPTLTKLAWKTSDDAKAVLPHELRTQAQLKTAIQTLAKIQSNPKRFKPIAMVIICLNPRTVPYERELQLLKDKLQCGTHIRPDCWCYVKPGCANLDEHVLLGIEELNLWAKKIHDGLGDPTGHTPPDCFRWAFEDIKRILKRRHDPEDLDNYIDNDKEELLFESLLRLLDIRFPKLDFTQYKGRLLAEGVVYARSLLHFTPEFYLSLGMEHATLGTLFEETERALRMCHSVGSSNLSARAKGKQRERALSFGNSDLEDSDADCQGAPNSDMSVPI